jgi:hypothetical protein
MKLTAFKKLVLAGMALALLLAALPAPALAAGDTVNFKIENRADRGITIRLYATDGSGRAYYMRVEKETTKTMNPLRGVYTYRLTACGVMVKGTIDLSKNANWIMPQCGHRAGQGSGAAATTDISKILKLISLKIVNRTGHTMKIWLEGPFQYVFIIPNGGSKVVTILKGDYEWGHYACDGVLDEGRISVQETKTRIFECN